MCWVRLIGVALSVVASYATTQLVLVGQRVGHAHLQVPRISFLAIHARPAERDARSPERFALPEHLVEALRASVQMVDAVVCRERIRASIERELRLPDAIAVSPDDGAEVR